MRDLMAALRTLALAEPSIAALVGTRVYVNRLPVEVIEAQDPFHPAKMLVLRQAGGEFERSLLPVTSTVVTAICYGESDFEADKVRRAVAQWLHTLLRDCEPVADVLIHDVITTGGPIPLVDPEITWPGVAQSYSVLADLYEEA